MWLENLMAIQMKNKLIYLLAIVAISIAYFVQYQYSISCMDDDLYRFIVPKGNGNFIELLCTPGIEKQPIESFKDVVESNINAYNNSNGRFIVHCIVQASCSFLTTQEFAILNAFVFSLFLLFLFRVSLPRPYRIQHVFISVFLFWFLLYKGRVYWGTIALTVNYMWCGVATLFFLLLYEYVKNNITHLDGNVLKCICVFFLSLIIGSLQESYSLGLLGALVLYYLFKYKKITIPLFILIGGYGLGTCLCSFAPGNLLRAEGRVSGFSLSFSYVYQFFTSPIVILLLITLVVCYINNKKRLYSSIKKDVILWLYLLLNCIFMSFIAFNGKHQLTCVQLLALILVLRLWFKQAEVVSRKLTWISVVLFTIVIASYYPILKLRKQLYNAYSEVTQMAIDRSKKDGLVVSEDYEKLVYFIRHNYFLREYHLFTYSYKKDIVSVKLSNGKKLDYIKILLPMMPNDIVATCTPNNEFIKNSNIFKLKYNYVAYRSKEKTDIYKTKLFFQESYAGGQLRRSESSIRAYERFEKDGWYYYIYPGSQHYGKILRVEEL